MLALILSTGFIILAAFFKAVSDTLKDHFTTSVFQFKDPRFWNPEISWKYAGYLKFTRYHLDAWHLSNSGMIFGFLFALVFHHGFFPWYVEWIGEGTLFNLSFNLFYNKILKR
jgi:hypothetical protein